MMVQVLCRALARGRRCLLIWDRTAAIPSMPSRCAAALPASLERMPPPR